MRKLMLLGLLFVGKNLCAQEISDNQLNFEISPIFNFKSSILSLTFDDGFVNQFTKAVPLLNARNIPATFYVPNYCFSDTALRNMVINAYKVHHEIGSHTVDHYNLVTLSRSKIDYELSQSQKAINTLLNSNQCLTLAYPFGPFNDTVIGVTKKYYLAARSVLSGYNLIDSFNRYFLKVMYYTRDAKIGLFNAIVNYTSYKHLWMIELIHGIDGQGYQPMNLDTLKMHLDYIKTKESTMWFATVSSVIKYYDERKAAKILCNDCNNKAYKIRLEDNLDDSIYNQPLSVSLRIPDNWIKVSVVGAEYVNLAFKGGQKFVLFNALPNNKEIIIRPDFITASKDEPETKLLTVEPNPFRDYVDVSFETTKPSNLKVILKNVNGSVLMMEYIVGNPINSIRFNTSGIPKGFYIVELINKISNENLTKKVVKIE